MKPRANMSPPAEMKPTDVEATQQQIPAATDELEEGTVIKPDADPTNRDWIRTMRTRREKER